VRLSISFQRVAAIAKVESKRLINDPMLLSIIFLLPIFQILLYGYAINLNPQHVRMAIAADDRELVKSAVDQLKSNAAVRLIGPVGPPGSAKIAVLNGKALIGIEARKPDAAQPLTVILYADGGDPQTVGRALAALDAGVWRGMAQNYAKTYAAEESPKVEALWLHNGVATPSVPDVWSISPGLIGVIVMVSMLFLGAFTLVRERESGSWETLLSTPATPLDALVGKLTPYLVIGVVTTAVLLLLVNVLFDVPLNGGAWALVLLAPAFAGGYLIIGFTFSALAQNQVQAAQSAVFIYLPSLMLSGFMFPFEGMPRWARIVGEIMPLTHYLRATRDVLIRGRGAEAVWDHTPPILLFTAVTTVFAVLAYRRRLS
jgi:ABC-2 type transport system permease protein